MPTAESLIRSFLERRNADDRRASFDFCYGYFLTKAANSSEIAKGANKQISCLHLMSYLASWGMSRGSSRLFQEMSMRHLLPLVELIGSGELDELWHIDCDRYTDQNIRLLVGAYNNIAEVVAAKDQQTLILVTKIMMGVFGCCPAFDTRVTSSLRTIFGKKAGKDTRCGFRAFNSKSLSLVAACYDSHRRIIEGYAAGTKVLCFDTGNETTLNYTKAKVLDMMLFQANGEPFTP